MSHHVAKHLFQGIKHTFTAAKGLYQAPKTQHYIHVAKNTNKVFKLIKAIIER